VPVNADIGTVEVIFVPGEDHQVNPLGIKVSASSERQA